jgi:hypothetical protein
MVYDKADIIKRRGYLCECGCGKAGEDLHHAFIHHIRSKGKTKYPQLNDKRNLIVVNHQEHITRKFDTREWRRKFWKKQVERYGEDAMMDWIESLPDKLKLTRLDFLND